MEKIAVMGSNSFTGSHCVNTILENTDYEVIGISRSPEYNKIFLPYSYKKEKPKKFNFHQLDINNDLDKIMKLLDKKQPKVIVNFAAQGEVSRSWDYPEQWFQTNCLGIVNLTNQLKDRKYLKRYIQISTPEIYGSCNNIKENVTLFDPSTPYAASKAAGDLFLLMIKKHFNFPLTMVRSTNVFGIHQQLYRIIPRTIIYLKKGKIIQLHGGGVAIKSFIHVRDVTEGILKIINLRNPSLLYHFSPDDKGRSIASVVKLVCKKMGYDFKKATKSTKERRGQDAKYVLDSSKAKSELKWHQKIKFEDGIYEMIEWIDENWKEINKQPLGYIHKP